MKQLRATAALLAAFVIGAMFVGPASTQSDISLEERVDILWADFCERKPTHPKCQPVSTPTPTPTLSPSPSPTPTDPVSCMGVNVTAPANIQTAVNNNPGRTTFCLSGDFQMNYTVKPKAGNSFIGPATLRGTRALERFDNLDNFGFEGVSIPNLHFEKLDMANFEIPIRPGPDGVVRDNNLHDNTRVGTGCGDCPGVLIEDNRLIRNGDQQWLGHGSGGTKLAAKADDAVVRNNLVVDNTYGIWFDLDALNAEAYGNTVLRSQRTGIHYEVSAGPCTIRDNVVKDNNWSNQLGGHGGITATSSKNCLIEDNELGGNHIMGIGFRNDSRGYSPPFNHVVRNNDLGGDKLNNCGEWGIVCSGNTNVGS
jgi:hypothetical protein